MLAQEQSRKYWRKIIEWDISLSLPSTKCKFMQKQIFDLILIINVSFSYFSIDQTSIYNNPSHKQPQAYGANKKERKKFQTKWRQTIYKNQKNEWQSLHWDL